MKRHTIRLDALSQTVWCEECGREFSPPLDPAQLSREECPGRSGPGRDLDSQATVFVEGA